MKDIDRLSDLFKRSIASHEPLPLDDILPFAQEVAAVLTEDLPVPVRLGAAALEQITEGGGITDARGIFLYAALMLDPETIRDWVIGHPRSKQNEIMEITSIATSTGAVFTAHWIENPAAAP